MVDGLTSSLIWSQGGEMLKVTQNLVQNLSHRSTMELHRSTMALEFFWIVGYGKIVIRWNYIVVRWYADAEK